jgi:hypothetical protein
MRRSGNVFSPVPRLGFSVAMPGMGPILGAEFVVCVGDICASFESAERLAAY